MNSMECENKCNGINCPIKNDCYRHTFQGDKNDLKVDYKYKEGKGCTFYWDNKS